MVLVVVVLVVVRLLADAPVAAPLAEAPVAAPLADAPVAAPLADAPLAPVAAPLEAGLVVVVVVVLLPVTAAAGVMLMNTTDSPLVAMLMKVPAALAELVAAALGLAAVVAPVPAVNEPLHWFCVNSCW